MYCNIPSEKQAEISYFQRCAKNKEGRFPFLKFCSCIGLQEPGSAALFLMREGVFSAVRFQVPADQRPKPTG
jgi:sulfur relay (sulfurtransferase) complex TusBCD TusD component (DsrE family)